jgi:hypothetical protein
MLKRRTSFLGFIALVIESIGYRAILEKFVVTQDLFSCGNIDCSWQEAAVIDNGRRGPISCCINRIEKSPSRMHPNNIILYTFISNGV